MDDNLDDPDADSDDDMRQHFAVCHPLCACKCVLSSWRNYIHCVVPGGGLKLDGSGWVEGSASYLLPVMVLGKLFRGKFCAGLKGFYQKGKLEFHGQLEELAEKRRFNELVHKAFEKKWVVYAKKPFAGPTTVLKYLARYTHRVGISNSRLVDISDGKVSFTVKDYRKGGEEKVMTLEACEFIRRFLQHIVPPHFRRIRYYGFMSARTRAHKLELCRQYLAELGHELPDEAALKEAICPAEVLFDSLEEVFEAAKSGSPCPCCGRGTLVAVEKLKPVFHHRRETHIHGSTGPPGAI